MKYLAKDDISHSLPLLGATNPRSFRKQSYGFGCSFKVLIASVELEDMIDYNNNMFASKLMVSGIFTCISFIPVIIHTSVVRLWALN